MRPVLAAALLALPLAGSAGIHLEDSAPGLAPVGSVSYNPKLNALTVDGAVYLPPVPPRDLTALCRALAAGDAVGASAAGGSGAWGVPADSEVALGLQLAELFLADIVFGRTDKTAGYKFAEAYKPRRDASQDGLAAEFRLRRFAFSKERGVHKASGGGLAIALNARRFPEAARNARHVAENLDYYRRETALSQAFRYAEAAAFLRGLRDGGYDLKDLAVRIESETILLRGPRNMGAGLDEYWADYLRSIEDRKEYANWAVPPYQLFLKKRSAPPI